MSRKPFRSYLNHECDWCARFHANQIEIEQSFKSKMPFFVETDDERLH